MNELLTSQALENLNISTISVLTSLIFSSFSAYIIRILYINFGRSLNNRQVFANNFILLAVVTCLIIIIVKYSLALSLGLVGALSIVRFRAAIKEPEELVYLFLVIAIGLAYGANQIIPGLLLTIFASGIIYITKNNTINNENFANFLLSIKGVKEDAFEIKSKLLHELQDHVESIRVKEFYLTGGVITINIYVQSKAVDKNILIEQIADLASSTVDLQLVSNVVIPE